MICPECQKGMVMEAEGGAPAKWVPCPRCQGSGIAYCCDGEDWYGVTECEELTPENGKAFIAGEPTLV